MGSMVERIYEKVLGFDWVEKNGDSGDDGRDEFRWLDEKTENNDQDEIDGWRRKIILKARRCITKWAICDF